MSAFGVSWLREHQPAGTAVVLALLVVMASLQFTVAGSARPSRISHREPPGRVRFGAGPGD
jgi:hypothetical protein